MLTLVNMPRLRATSRAIMAVSGNNFRAIACWYYTHVTKADFTRLMPRVCGEGGG